METVEGGSGTKIVLALLVASIIVVAGIVALSYHSPSTANSGTGSGPTTSGSSQTASSSSGQYAYSVVRENVSVPANVMGGVNCFWNLPCAIDQGDAICCVTLISYQGGYYYLDQVDFQGIVYTAWLTNSTVYCTNPVSGSFPECPGQYTTSDTTSIDAYLVTTTSPCGSPGVYCGPGFDISNASLTSAMTLGENYSALRFNVNGTYSGLRIATLSIWLANANSSEPTGSNGAHLVGKISPTWSDKDGGYYTFDVPMTGFNAVKGVQCELWIDAYFAPPSPLSGDNWAEQNMTIG